ncbi:uncharacterized protein LOC133527539 isoform X2 [Cydia pomonella]|uniref:uncharacterized protein LOC133527539 isoform X2 n=1 Tax=Cydia pomonella TaxID=82600 RepID=UPI002ADE1053|nr:uncharacterized protein LOC133527539 isoform X2 [Cydia pomonella]
MEPEPGTSKNSSPASPSLNISKSRLTRARKRRRVSSDSSSDTDPVLPENLLEVEKNLHASAMKNNLDDVSVKKILKTVVTNDHVLALVKLQEEEENMEAHSDTPKPKLTRSKAKELRKVSPKTAWNLENLELTPIKHIPVKTRPEVTALIAQELPEDEDDEEYDPRADDVPSDDDQTLESCSDLDSQPRTPATPRRTASPRIVKDGPFKVPQEISTPRRKLDTDEEATIALRTRSKLSLSAVPIDHIEGSFVPPDEPPTPAADDVWTEFLHICLNPDTEAQDDDDDPEYNVAQDPDAHDEDEEGLENIMKISKKELNDLVTELFSVMPEGLGDELGGKLTSETGKNKGKEQNQSSTSCKQEPSSEEETPQTAAQIQTRGKEKRLSIGKSEVLTDSECQESDKENKVKDQVPRPPPPTEVTISVVENGLNAVPGAAGPSVPPPPLQSLLVSTQTVVVQVEQGVKVLPEQLEIYRQQLRQHVQICASNFLQLFVHPVHWALAPTYKENLETFYKLVEDNPDSVANVCNLKPALDLVRSWETSVSADTPENMEMIAFVQKEIERSRRRAAQNNLYVGDFPKTFMNVVSNSPVFLYPHLLPPMPFRSDVFRKFGYLRCEDELLALGLDQFWQYVEDNPDLFNLQPTNSVHRAGLIATLQLVCKHMFPWIKPKGLLAHIRHVRQFRKDNKDNPIIKFFETREVTPVKHTLLPFSASLTLYEQPENEMPRIWVRHLAKSSKRFMDAKYRRTTFLHHFGQAPAGVPVRPGAAAAAPPKPPLPIAFTRQYSTCRPSDLPKHAHNPQDRYDIQLAPPQDTATLTPVATTTETFQIVNYSVVNTPSGAFLIPVTVATTVTDSATTPICSSEVNETSQTKRLSVSIPINPVNKNVTNEISIGDHCLCCVKLRRISKLKQTLITDFLNVPKKRPSCPCKEKKSTKYPRATKKLRLLVNSYKAKYSLAWSALDSQVKMLKKSLSFKTQKPMVPVQYNLEEIAAVTSFQLKLTMRSNVARSVWVKKRIYSTIAQFNPDTDNIYTFMKNIEKILDTEGVDVYKEFLGFLTMEQADKIGNYADYFNQECLTGLMKKVEELVECRKRKYEILHCVYNTLVVQRWNACDICSRILDSCDGYPSLAEYVFSLFPHTNPILDPKDQNKVPIREENKNTPAPSARILINSAQINNKKDTGPTVELNIGKDEEDRAVEHTDNVQNSTPQTVDNIEAQRTDSIEHKLEQRTDNMEVDNDNTENVEESVRDESQAMDYEADHSASDDDSRNNSLIINENPEELNETQDSIIKTEEPVSENIIETPQPTMTKNEFQDYSESDMSMMIMSEDEHSIKKEAPEWKRDEDKTLLEVLKQSLTPEEMKDKTILEIIEQKKVLQLASESLPEKSLDDVRERILYLLEFLVLNESMIS